MNKNLKISRLSLKLIGIVVISACISALVFSLLFFNRYRMFYMFNDRMAIKENTKENVKKLQKTIDKLHISKENNKAIRKQMHKFRGYTMYLYDGEANIDREYLISSLENKAYLQTSSFSVRLYEPITQEFELKFYDGSYTLYVDSYQGVAFMMRYLLVVCTFSVFIFISIIMIFIRRKMRYVLEIGEEMHQIEDGNFHHTIMYKGNDEITNLAKQLNHLRTVLYENTMKEEDARKANEELVTAMSHDLRTPLTSLMGYLDILNMKIYKSDEERDNYIGKAREKAEQIKAMSDRLFNHFLVYAQQNEVQCETLSDEDIIKILKIFCDELKDQHFKVYDVFEDQPFQIRVDYKLMERILTNLYSNLCKYAEKEMVVVALSQYKGQVLIKVKNRKKKDTSQEESTHIGMKSIHKMMKDMGANVEVEEDYESYCVHLIFPCREVENEVKKS